MPPVGLRFFSVGEVGGGVVVVVVVVVVVDGCWEVPHAVRAPNTSKAVAVATADQRYRWGRGCDMETPLCA